MIATTLIAIIIFGLILLAFYQKKTNAVCVSKKRMDGKTVLVTGGTAGMGLEIATEIARRGARVIVACPFPKEGASAMSHIVQSTGNNDVVFQHLDLASLASVRRFAATILESESRLDILVNNAGIGGSDIPKTVDGNNFIMQVNYFGSFLLTILLLPMLKKSGRPHEPSRILNTASTLHMLGFADTQNLSSMKVMFPYSQHYSNSKFCVVLFTRELAKRLQGENVVVNTIDPGAVGTRIFDTWSSSLGSVIRWASLCFFKTPWQGAQTALHVALDEAAANVSGKYFKNCSQAKAIYRAYDDQLAKKVWEESLRIVKLEEAVQ